jgi:hypothetical protein
MEVEPAGRLRGGGHCWESPAAPRLAASGARQAAAWAAGQLGRAELLGTHPRRLPSIGPPRCCRTRRRALFTDSTAKRHTVGASGQFRLEARLHSSHSSVFLPAQCPAAILGAGSNHTSAAGRWHAPASLRAFPGARFLLPPLREGPRAPSLMACAASTAARRGATQPRVAATAAATSDSSPNSRSAAPAAGVGGHAPRGRGPTSASAAPPSQAGVVGSTSTTQLAGGCAGATAGMHLTCSQGPGVVTTGGCVRG